MIRRKQIAVVAVVGTVLLAACGSSEASSDSTGPRSASTDTAGTYGAESADTTEAPPVPTQDVEADTAAAQAALLALSDFPAGWSETPAVDESDPEINRQIAACGGYDGEGFIDTQAEAETGDFTNADGDVFISQNIGIAATEEEAVAALAGLANPDILTCAANVYNGSFIDSLPDDAFADGVEIGEITVARLNVTPVGDDTQAIRVVLPLSSGGFNVDVIIDLVLVRVGRSLSGLAAQSQFSPVPIELLDEINAIAASRLAVSG